MHISKNEFEEHAGHDVKGGSGPIYSKDIWPCGRFPLKHGKFCRLVRIPPGSSLGKHAHEGETEFFAAQSGEAVVFDNGRELPFLPGDVLLTGNGEEHAVRNESTEDFTMVSMILYE